MTYSLAQYKNWKTADPNDFIMESGHWLMLGAFYETSRDKTTLKYTLKIAEVDGLPSAYQIILWSNSEYEAAMKLCGDWSIWKRWKESKILYEGNTKETRGFGLQDALEAQQQRIAAEALATIIQKSEDGDYRASKDLVMWNVPKMKTGKKVRQVPSDRKDNVLSLAKAIAKK